MRNNHSAQDRHGLFHWPWRKQATKTPWERFREECEMKPAPMEQNTDGIPAQPVQYPILQTPHYHPVFQRGDLMHEYHAQHPLPVRKPAQTTGPIVLEDFSEIKTLPLHNWRTVQFVPPPIDTSTVNPPTPAPDPPVLPDWLAAPISERPAPVDKIEVALKALPQGDQWTNVEFVELWGEPEKRETLFSDVRQPSRPLEDDAPTVEHERTIRNKLFKQAITGLLGQESEK
jgi:hypothetical protein